MLDKQRLRAINKCSNSRYSLLPVWQTACSFTLCLPRFQFFLPRAKSIPLSSVSFVFCLVSFFYTPPPPMLYCSVLWLDEISSRTTLTLSELVIPLAISTRLRREKKGGQGAFRRSCTHCKEGAVGITLQARPRQTGGLAWRPLEIKVYLIGHIHGQLSHNKDRP